MKEASEAKAQRLVNPYREISEIEQLKQDVHFYKQEAVINGNKHKKLDSKVQRLKKKRT